MKQPAALAAALLIASTIPVIAGGIMAPPPDVASLLLAIIVYIYACFFIGIFGLPAYLLLARLGWARWWSATAVGLLGGAVIGAFVWKPYASLGVDVPVIAATGMSCRDRIWAMVTQSGAIAAVDLAFGSLPKPEHLTNFMHYEECGAR